MNTPPYGNETLLLAVAPALAIARRSVMICAVPACTPDRSASRSAPSTTLGDARQVGHCGPVAWSRILLDSELANALLVLTLRSNRSPSSSSCDETMGSCLPWSLYEAPLGTSVPAGSTKLTGFPLAYPYSVHCIG